MLSIEHQTCDQEINDWLQASHCHAVTLGTLLTPVSLCHQEVQFDNGLKAVMSHGWEGI